MRNQRLIDRLKGKSDGVVIVNHVHIPTPSRELVEQALWVAVAEGTASADNCVNDGSPARFAGKALEGFRAQFRRGAA